MRHLLFATLTGLALASASPAFAKVVDTSTYGSGSPQEITGSVRLSPDHVVSLAQLQGHLEKLGYSDVRLTPQRPNQFNPRPDLSNSATMTMRSDSPVTPAHHGWNGTAVHDGKRVSVIVG